MRYFSLIFVLTSFYTYSQKLDARDMYKILKENDPKKRTEFLLRKKFIHINNENDSVQKFIYNKNGLRFQDIDQENMEIKKDTTIQTLLNPKMYMKYISKLKYATRKKPTISENKTTYYLMNVSVIFEEIIKQKSDNTSRREYTFKYYLKE